jgi:hypothetical protein
VKVINPSPYSFTWPSSIFTELLQSSNVVKLNVARTVTGSVIGGQEKPPTGQGARAVVFVRRIAFLPGTFGRCGKVTATAVKAYGY